MKGLILTGNQRNDRLVEAMARRKKLAGFIADSILRYHGKDRWLETHRLWLAYWPNAPLESRDAIKEAAGLRKTMIDPLYGRSAAAMGKAADQTKTNKNTQLRVLAVLPESFKTLLMRVDPFNLGPAAQKRKENWREVYKALPQYKVPEKV